MDGIPALLAGAVERPKRPVALTTLALHARATQSRARPRGERAPASVMTRTLLIHGRIWQWSQAALAGPKAMLAAADEGTAHTMAEWMLLEHGRIASVGTGAPPEAGEADTIDLGGRLVLPGLIDAQQLVESAAKLATLPITLAS